MPKHHAVVAMCCLLGASAAALAQAPSAHSIYVFDARLALPGVCTVWGRPSVLDGRVQITCDLDPANRPDSIHVYVSRAERCKLGSLAGEGQTVRYETERNSRFYSEAVGAGGIIIRAVSDGETCLLALSSSAKDLDEFLRPVWF
jgi:hypothetical protein